MLKPLDKFNVFCMCIGVQVCHNFELEKY